MKKFLVIADNINQEAIALQQALALSLREKATLHVVYFCYEDEEIPNIPADQLQQKIIQQIDEKAKQQLADIFGEQVKYDYEVVWSKRIHLWVNDYIKDHMIDLVIKTGNRTTTRTYTSTDWHLIRECNIPILIATETKWRKSPNVLAAIDLATKRDEKWQLNRQVLTKAKLLADQLNVKLYVCYTAKVSPLLKEFGLQFTDEVEILAEKNYRTRMNEIAADLDIAPEQCFIKAGQAEKVIPSLAAKTKSGVVVIGTVGRKGIKAKIIGNTAEKIFNLLKSDVLAIKPE